MLYPQLNSYRSVIDLSGIWELKVDRENKGVDENWFEGYQADTLVAVPGSWNEQLAEFGLKNYIGTVWYQTEFYLPHNLDDQRILVRFGSVDHNAKVWLNGQSVGEHVGGFLPFECDLKGTINLGGPNKLVVRASSQLDHGTIPQGVTVEDYLALGKAKDQNFPPSSFDFFPYGGIHRPVKLIVLNKAHIDYIKIATRIDGPDGLIDCSINLHGATDSDKIVVQIIDDGTALTDAEIVPYSDSITAGLRIPDCQPWSPETPRLYTLQVQLERAGNILDEYQLDVGVREVKLLDDGLYLNGERVYLKGFGKHEDFPVIGKGLSHPLLIKDFQLMKWIGANSFRTSHYPYSEETMQLADRLGFLVIDETPAVSLNFRFVNEQTLASHKNTLQELVARDRNHPSVIMWSVANEPGLWGEVEAKSPAAHAYWKEIFEFTRSLDISRPLTLTACTSFGNEDPVYEYVDLIAINRYWGWYELPGQIEVAADKLKNEIEGLHTRFGKPIMLTEFGADTIEGHHSTVPELFTEEYQIELIKAYFEVAAALPYIAGEHIWNFADFRTVQHHRRVVHNRKGVFNRVREPKSVAFVVRKHWLGG